MRMVVFSLLPTNIKPRTPRLLSKPWAVFALVAGIIVGYDVEIYPVLRLDFPVLSPPMTRTEETYAAA